MLTDGMKKLIEPLRGVHMQGRAFHDLSTPERAEESWKRTPPSSDRVAGRSDDWAVLVC
jgi:hypothetical protein